MAVYEIINLASQKALNIAGPNLKGTSLYDGQKITLWSRSGSNEQLWVLGSGDKQVPNFRSCSQSSPGQCRSWRSFPCVSGYSSLHK